MAGRAFLARAYAFRFLDGFVLIYPLYTVMFAARGLSPSQVAAALMAWSVTGFFLQIPMGVLADRFSRRWMLCLGQVLRGLGFAIWIVQPNFTGFLIGMVLWGVKSAMTNGVFEALVYDELHAIGEAYGRLLEGDRTYLRGQMQAYASCDDPELCATVQAGYGDLVAYVERVSGADPATVAAFFAKGMLMNVLSSMHLSHPTEPWAVRLLAGCKETV